MADDHLLKISSKNKTNRLPFPVRRKNEDVLGMGAFFFPFPVAMTTDKLLLFTGFLLFIWGVILNNRFFYLRYRYIIIRGSV